MHRLLVFLLFSCIAGCVVNSSDATLREEGKEAEWRVISTEKEFLRRYPDLSVEYFSWVRKVELLYDSGQKKREAYLKLNPEEERVERVKLRNDAKLYYMRALKEAKKILDRTKASSIAQLISRIATPLMQVQHESEREKGLIKEE